MINNSKPQSAGGKAYGLIQRKRAEQLYLENPNYCLYCKEVIPLDVNKKVHEIRVKKFCNRSHAASYNNHQFIKRIARIKIPKVKILVTPYVEKLGYLTKEKVFSSRKNWQSARTDIRRHAAFIMNFANRIKKCEKCPYDKHVEICHKQSVSSFSGETLLNYINRIENLVYLCPNCHWEFDHNMIQL